MLNKCTCGRYTDYGITCISCSISIKTEHAEDEEINVDDLIMLERTELQTNYATQLNEDQAPNVLISTEELPLYLEEEDSLD